jgi:hypothetical protein
VDPVDYRLLAHTMGAYDTSYDVGGSTFLADKANPWAFDYTSLWPGLQPGDTTTLSLTYTWAVRQYMSYIGAKPKFGLPFAEPVEVDRLSEALQSLAPRCPALSQGNSRDDTGGDAGCNAGGNAGGTAGGNAVRPWFQKVDL